MRRWLIASVWIVLAPAATILIAQEHHHAAASDPTARVASTQQATRPTAKEQKERESAPDRIKVTEHVLRAGARQIRYRAHAGVLAQTDEAGNAKADIFFVAYEMARGANEGSATTRPVTFVFNGGPGAASVWLHLGTAGPKRVALGPDGLPAGPPVRLVENESAWLDATDLVFIDPVGTGYSRPAPGEKAEQFYGVAEDIRSIGAFIRLWTTRYQRWPNPKFLAGESYGTTRAAGLSEFLLEREGIALNGIVLISSVLNFQTLQPGPGNELPYPLYLPSYTAAAWHHKKLDPALQRRELEDVLKEVEAWAMGDYWVALGKGQALGEQEKRRVADRLVRYTGLPLEYIQRSDLRMGPGRFMKQLLIDERKVLGRFDSRVTGFDADPLAAEPAYDPSLAGYIGVYSAGFNHYVRTELDFESDLPYEVLTSRVQPWNFGPGGSGYLYVADDLRNAMLKNPRMKVLFCSGLIDLATPYLATKYTISHMGLPEELVKNVVQTHYRAGHMMYHDDKSRRKLHDDVADFVRTAAAEKAVGATAPVMRE